MRQLALEPLWRAYEACAPGADTREVLERIVRGLGLKQVGNGASGIRTPAVLRCGRVFLRAVWRIPGHSGIVRHSAVPGQCPMRLGLNTGRSHLAHGLNT